jgi:iron complex outermembrane receptor protein
LSSVPGYAEADVRLGWQPVENWELSVVGQNLLHARHPEFNPPGSRLELQRAIFAKASWRF